MKRSRYSNRTVNYYNKAVSKPGCITYLHMYLYIFSYPNNFSYLNTFYNEEVHRGSDNRGSAVYVIRFAKKCIAEASFFSLPDIHQCPGGLQLAPSCLDQQTAGRESPHNWLVRLGMNLATFCNMWG